MTSYSSRITAAGIRSGRLHPEVAGPAKAVMRRDMKALRRHRVLSLVRLPYADLDELGQLKGMGWTSADPPVAVIVVSLSPTDNARVPAADEETVAAWIEAHPSARDLRGAAGRGFG